MKKYFRAGAVGTGLAVLVLAGAGVAYAHHTVVSVNGNHTSGTVPYTADNDTAEISFMTDGGVEMRCPTATIEGDIMRGVSVTVPNVVGTIDDLSFTDCEMAPFDLDVTMTGGNIEVRNHPASAGGDVDVTITDVEAQVTATSGGTCTFKAEGTLDAVIKPGSGGKDAVLELVSAEFDGPDPVSGFDLDISNVSGCAGQVTNSDFAGGFYYDEGNGIESAFEIDTTGVVTHVVP